MSGRETNIASVRPFIWAIILLALIRPVIVSHVPDGFYRKFMCEGEMVAYTWSNLVFFCINDLLLLIAAFGFQQFTKSIVSYIFIGVCIGKIFDEFASPFGWWWGEVLWDIGVFIGACIEYWRRKKNSSG